MLSKFIKYLSCIIAMAVASTPMLSFAEIEEIIVTAEKRAESAQDVGSSLQAFDEEALQFGGIEDVSRLELLVPGVNFAFAGNDAKFNVRWGKLYQYIQ